MAESLSTTRSRHSGRNLRSYILKIVKAAPLSTKSEDIVISSSDFGLRSSRRSVRMFPRPGTLAICLISLDQLAMSAPAQHGNQQLAEELNPELGCLGGSITA